MLSVSHARAFRVVVLKRVFCDASTSPGPRQSTGRSAGQRSWTGPQRPSPGSRCSPCSSTARSGSPVSTRSWWSDGRDLPSMCARVRISPCVQQWDALPANRTVSLRDAAGGGETCLNPPPTRAPERPVRAKRRGAGFSPLSGAERERERERCVSDADASSYGPALGAIDPRHECPQRTHAKTTPHR
jgi:hypothetical protein